MAGVGMNVMHDGNHGALLYQILGKQINGWKYLHLSWKCLQLANYNTMFYTIHIPTLLVIYEDLEAGRILRFLKQPNGYSHHRFQHYYSVFLYGLLTFNWAITTDFLQMKRYLKENYHMVKQKVQLSMDHFNHN